MLTTRYLLIAASVTLALKTSTFADPVIFTNQVAFDSQAPKMGVVRTDAELTARSFSLVDVKTHAVAFAAPLGSQTSIDQWAPGHFFYRADFSTFAVPGNYQLQISSDTPNGPITLSAPFEIGDYALAKTLIPAILGYFRKDRADAPGMLEVDKHVRLWGGTPTDTIDIRGGWCDASGDISKYLSHLAHANFMSPQQSGLTAWTMGDVYQRIPAFLDSIHQKDNALSEAVWGADYMMRALSPQGFFYMVVFSDFSKDTSKRRVCALLPNSKKTADYQCAFREGGGMAIAALARISTLHKDGDFTSEQYLAAAERAFDHLVINNVKYCDDGKENILDDYCALMAATELWIATDKPAYRDYARQRASNLHKRMTPAGYFTANDVNRPFWHAADAGLPVVALARYLDKETDASARQGALDTLHKNLDYQLAVTGRVDNPFGYARQSFLFHGTLTEGFFIPHDNESGWWWQGENARLASLATAALRGGKLIHPEATFPTPTDPLSTFAYNQLSWILGNNPYSVCMMYGFGQKFPKPESAGLFGHGPIKGGISNGISGGENNPDGSGIHFADGNGGNWRWSEQWIPHATWFLEALADTVPNESPAHDDNRK